MQRKTKTRTRSEGESSGKGKEEHEAREKEQKRKTRTRSAGGRAGKEKLQREAIEQVANRENRKKNSHKNWMRKRQNSLDRGKGQATQVVKKANTLHGEQEEGGRYAVNSPERCVGALYKSDS